MGNSYALLDMTVFGRQETWEDSPTDWPRWKGEHPYRTDGRPIVQWSRLKAGQSDDLGTTPASGVSPMVSSPDAEVSIASPAPLTPVRLSVERALPIPLSHETQAIA